MGTLPLLPEPNWLWLALLLLLPIVLVLDSVRGQQSAGEARAKTVLLALLSLGFAALLACYGGPTGPSDASAFVTAWLIELALSVDNLLVFLLLFDTFRASDAQRTRVLSYGIYGALLLRAGAILSGLALIERFAFLLPVFGLLLVLAGAKLLWPHSGHGAAEPALVRMARRVLPMASAAQEGAHPHAFVVREGWTLRCTQLGVLLFAIELSDLLFAVDSVPAGFAVTQNAWILCGSNALAILGLRALFIALQGALASLRFLSVGLALVLVFIGLKMVFGKWFEISMVYSLCFVATALGIAVAASFIWPQKERDDDRL